jgi:hypothetical protein
MDLSRSNVIIRGVKANLFTTTLVLLPIFKFIKVIVTFKLRIINL